MVRNACHIHIETRPIPCFLFLQIWHEKCECSDFHSASTLPQSFRIAKSDFLSLSHFSAVQFPFSISYFLPARFPDSILLVRLELAFGCLQLGFGSLPSWH